ncbi:xanthine dehydrogenase small subunit [Polaromonas sp. OV174]|nr:xanthine dehydrogenase small subunit [Polaromonas sp. OV174]
MAPTLPTSCGSLPPEGVLRLRPGRADSAAPAGGYGNGPVLHRANSGTLNDYE